jgi:hypothetical protein
LKFEVHERTRDELMTRDEQAAVGIKEVADNAAVLGRVVELQPAQHAARFAGRKGLAEQRVSGPANG